MNQTYYLGILLLKNENNFLKIRDNPFAPTKAPPD